MKSKINPFRSPGISGAAISAAAIIFACFALLSSSAQATDALFVGSDGDHNLTTGSNWVGGSPAGDWDRMIFDGAVMDGLLDLNNFNGRSGITLTSDVTQDITILNDQPLIMGAVTSDGGIDMSSAAHDLTINTPYWIWGDAYWNVGAGRTLTINSGPSHDGSPTNPAPNSVTKNGVGSALLTSAAYYTGGTTINSGTFHASHALAVGSGGVTVNGGATLAVNAISANTGLTLLESNYGSDLGQIGTLPFAQRLLAATNPAYSQTNAVLYGNGGGGRDYFSQLYTGLIKINTGDTYEFNTTSDDGSLLWIDGQQVVYNNYLQAMTTRSGTIPLGAGYHNIQIAFQQRTGGFDTVTLTVPRGLAGKRFARLVVNPEP
ncbi:MAG: PA14 domain-containing protein [Verrucomicrobiota bacterium]